MVAKPLCGCPREGALYWHLRRTVVLSHSFGQVHFQFKLGVFGLFSAYTYITEIPALNANSVDPDQMPQNVALIRVYTVCRMSLLWVARHINGLR